MTKESGLHTEHKDMERLRNLVYTLTHKDVEQLGNLVYTVTQRHRMTMEPGLHIDT